MNIKTLVFAALTVMAVPAFAAHHEGGHGAMKAEGTRAMVVAIVGEIVAIDNETKEVTLQGPEGNQVTVVAQEQVVKVSDLSVGDRVAAEYLASIHGEAREPTEEELANPWVVLEEGVVDEAPEHPAVGVARQIRAVVTIEAIDVDAGFLMIKDSRGKMHTIGGVPRAKLDAISIGEMAVVVYTEALAIGLQKMPKAM
jgi:Cu/Ag efflux protein CusF